MHRRHLLLFGIIAILLTALLPNGRPVSAAGTPVTGAPVTGAPVTGATAADTTAAGATMPGASGADASARQVYYAKLTGANVALTGAMAAQTFYYQLEDYWSADAVTIHLDYQATQLSARDRSSVTLAMNGTKFYSFRPAAGDKKQRLTVSVPKELIVKGSNSLTVEGNIETTVNAQICLPTENLDNWLQIYDSSDAAIGYTVSAPSGGIADFAVRFTGLDAMQSGLSALAVPTSAEPAELAAAVQALSGFARANAASDRVIPIARLDSAALADKPFVVAVALYDRLPAAYKQAVGDGELQDKAVLRTFEENGRWTLIVTSDNPELLVKAGRLLANRELVGQLAGRSKEVGESTAVDTPAVEIDQTVPLTETGDKLLGSLHREKSYFISLPGNRKLADASRIRLDYRYAGNLDFTRSMVTVLLNDKPIGSKRLTAALADGDSLELPIPPNTDVTGSFTLTVAFDLMLPASGCVEPTDQMPWAYITSDSMLRLNTKDDAELLFDSYPNPFLRDGRFNQIAVVLPQEADDDTYGAVANLFNLLGRYAAANTGDVRFYDDSVADSELQNRNVIAVGTYRNNRVIRERNDRLYFRYDSAGEGLVSNEKMSIDEDYGKRLGAVQLLESPYQAGLALLAVTGSTSENVLLASQLLESDAMKWKIFGDAAVTDKDGTIRAFRFQKDAGPSQAEAVGEALSRPDVLQYAAVAGAILLFIVIALLLLIRKYRKKGSARDEN